MKGPARVTRTTRGRDGPVKITRTYYPIKKSNLGRNSRRAASSVSSGGGRFLQGFARGRRRQLIYARDVRRPLVGSGLKKQGGGRGRPKGSYDARYAAYGGVYGYRKALSLQYAQQKAQYLRNAAVTPQQQAYLAQLQARQQAQQQAPENQIIPNTSGRISAGDINQEISDAANLVP